MAEETGNLKGAAVRLPSGRSHGLKSSRRDNRDPWRKALRCAAAGGGGWSLPRWRSRSRPRILRSTTAMPGRPPARRQREEAQTRRQETLDRAKAPTGTGWGFKKKPPAPIFCVSGARQQAQNSQEWRHRQPLHDHRKGDHAKRGDDDFVPQGQRRWKRQCQCESQRASQSSPPQKVLRRDGNCPPRASRTSGTAVNRL